MTALPAPLHEVRDYKVGEAICPVPSRTRSEVSLDMSKMSMILPTISRDAEEGSGAIKPSENTKLQGFNGHQATFRKRVNSLRGKSRKMWNRLNGKERERIGVWKSLKAIATSSFLNIFLLFIPFAWTSHFKHWGPGLTLALCFLSIIPLEKLFEWGGEQMAMYLGLILGDLLIITLDNAVEATLAIILLRHCQLRVLQSTIVGVVVLHLLLVPGTAFLIGGAKIWEQNLHPHTTQLNNSLLTVGVLSLLLPTALFNALDNGTGSQSIVTDELRGQILQMSRGAAVILLVIYVASRIFLANPPGGDSVGMLHPSAPQAMHDEENKLKLQNPEVNSWVCIAMLIVAVALMGTTAEFLVESIEIVREDGHIGQEWFGVILLPIVSFSADGCVAIMYFLRKLLKRIFSMGEPEIPSELAKARAIDLSIQFILFWMPFIVLLAWWMNTALPLWFDLYEVTLLIGTTFLVNYITQDAKTNWVEGLIMIGSYTMIALCTWFYVGQAELNIMLTSGRCQAVSLSG